MVIKIENYEDPADTFTFPNNPNTFDDDISSNHTVTNVDYQRFHYFVSGGGIAPKSLILTGHFNGTSKNDSYLELTKHFTETQKLKKLYWESDKFYLGVGSNIKKTHTGGRTNFLDYVANFQTIIGILFDNTQQTHTDGGADFTNDGNTKTFIEEIAGTYDGTGDVVISDGLGNQITIPASAFSGSQNFVIKFVEMLDSGDGIFVTEYNYTEVNSVQIKTIQTTSGLGMIQLDSSASTSTISVTNTNAGWTVKFRNGWTA